MMMVGHHELEQVIFSLRRTFDRWWWCHTCMDPASMHKIHRFDDPGTSRKFESVSFDQLDACLVQQNYSIKING